MKNNCPIVEKKSGCIASAMTVIGCKWTALILRDLANGKSRFTELAKSLNGISPKTLSQRLDELEDQKIITKKIFNEVPPRVEYTLTNKGKDLMPILKQMAIWGEKHYDLELSKAR
jgi:DNA-binding HxlR family transcriptional regulator